MSLFGRAKFELDRESAARFQKTLKKYQLASGKSFARVANRAGMKLAYEAIFRTKHADRAAIMALKEISHYQKYGTGKKQQRLLKKPKAIYKATDRGFLTYLWHQHKKGINIRSKFPDRASIEAAALRMVNARLSSIHFLRSGWTAAARKLRRHVEAAGDLGKTRRVPGFIERRRVRGGGASPARAFMGNKATCTIWNSHVPRKKKRDTAMEVLQDGLRKSVDPVRRDMMVYVRRKMKEHAQEFNHGRVTT